ncbi:MAG: RluA family pseudouridine synthase [Trueperella sp.]|nr:RluA family pseudouridine synthase [Trueperella sp.]
MNTYLVPPGLDEARVDAAVAKITGISRSKAAELIEAGKVWHNGETTLKASRVANGDVLEVELPPPPLEPQPTPAALDIIYEDADIVVVDKPAGMAAHASLNFEGPNVLGALLAQGVKLTTSGPPERKGIVHRLDVGTTGCMVVAKSEVAYTVLKRAFKERTVTKIYHALVHGHPDPSTGTIDAPIGRDMRYQWKMGVRQDGKPAITHYDTVEAMAGASLIRVELETGRTHQIRVHMAATRHPCIGDEMYGADPVLAEKLALDRQWLHAVELSFVHPRSGEIVEFRSDYPPQLQTALELMRAGML